MHFSHISDADLLTRWVNRRDEAAFHVLVTRYANLVHMAALRTGGCADLAAEASQSVFILLARKAESLRSHASLAGWLHLAAVNTARDLIDKDRREACKRQQFMIHLETRHSGPEDGWTDLQLHLDTALAGLSARDREALLLRFYRALSVKEVADELGIAVDAAQKRIGRATDRLRAMLVRRGCRAGGTLTGILLAGYAADAQAASVPAASMLAGKAAAAFPLGTATATESAKMAALAAPAVILLAGCAWVAAQYREIGHLEEGNAAISRKLGNPQSAGVRLSPNKNLTTALDRKPVDWAEVARQLKVSQSHAAVNPQAEQELRLSSMNREEMLSSLGEIEEARLTDDDRELLQRRICTDLAKTEDGPKLVLERFAESISKGQWPWVLGACFKSWLDKDPDRAIEWLAKNQHRMKRLSPGFLPMSFYPLLESSPAAASRLLKALPPERRLESLRSVEHGGIPPDPQVAWAMIVRNDIPEAQRADAIAWPTMNWSDGDGAPLHTAGVTGYLKRIRATASERRSCIIASAREHASVGNKHDNSLAPAEWVEEFRSWVEETDPGLTAIATGEGLAAWNYPPVFAQAAEIGLTYHRAHPDDNLLLPMLEKDHAADDFPIARKLAENLTQEELRRKYLEKYRQSQR